ncbi:hypothetical protein OHA21_38480 [Actinoplanes sp. NBC_00393]|uniref:hypothetical protein n=1 Tax=Actinoplanes sp. NBC_00393 TaxID=2975953 RepID=UPI002E204EBD
MTASEPRWRSWYRPHGSCASCLAWGKLHWTLCYPCYNWQRTHQNVAVCAACNREQVGKAGYCRMCWAEASRRMPKRHGDSLAPVLARLRWHQLYFTNMRQAVWRHRITRHAVLELPLLERGCEPLVMVGQLTLFDAERDLSRATLPVTFSKRPDLERYPHVAIAWDAADRLAELQGWSSRTLATARRGLAIALACRPADEPVHERELVVLARRDYPIHHMATVLADAGLLGQRVDKVEAHWQRRLHGVGEHIAADIDSWLRWLRHGDERTQPRSGGTVSEYARRVASVAHAWTGRYTHLREITREEITRTAGALTAAERTQTLIALRSLFGYLHRRKRVFTNPTSRTKPGSPRRTVLLPLTEQDYRDLNAACTTPMHHLVLALSAVHAASPHQIRHLLLDDIDVGNRRLVIGAVDRHLDPYTLSALETWLRHRRERWPATTNRHLLISNYTASTSGPISSYTLTHLFQPSLPGLDRIRRDRQLEEALSHGPDPLHLSIVFGIHPSTAAFYADSARQLLEQAAAPSS